MKVIRDTTEKRGKGRKAKMWSYPSSCSIIPIQALLISDVMAESHYVEERGKADSSKGKGLARSLLQIRRDQTDNSTSKDRIIKVQSINTRKKKSKTEHHVKKEKNEEIKEEKRGKCLEFLKNSRSNTDDRMND